MLFDKRWEKHEVETPSLDDEAREILRVAATYLEKYGWCQRLLRDGDARCAVGAIVEADALMSGRGPFTLSSTLYQRKTVAASMAYDKLCSHVRVELLEKWNDEEGRTMDEVVSAMRESADA